MKSIFNSFILAAVLGSGLLLASCTKEANNDKKASSSPAANAIDPGTGAGNTVLTLTGSGLDDMVSIVFDKGGVPASFNPNFNTDKSLIFRVPDTANGGPQNIIFTNRLGKSVSVPFNVIALPSVSDVSNYNYTGGTIITLTGNNLNDVTSAILTGTTTAVTIVSKTKKQLVVSMPTTTINRSKMDITNSTGTITTTQEFINLDKAFKLFTDDYAPGFQDASWGDAGQISTTVYKSGTKSVYKKFAADNWHQIGFGWTNVDNSANYTYLSFWIKGASKDYTLWISTSTSVGGFASFNDNAKIAVPANVWTYFKIPLSQLNLWATGSAWNQIGWRIQGPSGQDETFYLDDVILVK
jgi:hypothetical protein